MSNFHTFPPDVKRHYHTILSNAVQRFGGTNFFLQLVEAVRAENTNPLTSGSRVFDTDIAYIKWNKVVFNDKLVLLKKIKEAEGAYENLLPESESKQYKKVLNLVRTLKPIVFRVQPKHGVEGEGLIFQPFERIDETTTRLSPLFDAIFLCSVDTVKKAIAYTPEDA